MLKNPMFQWRLMFLVLVIGCSGVFAAGTVPSKGAVRINPKDGAVMVWVPAGEFIMGNTTVERGEEQWEDQKPRHKVCLDGYWMYKYEVTVMQYKKFCKATKRKMPKAPHWGWKDNHPIVNVSWFDAETYSMWADVSLPTEAQWEKAARGTDARRYPWGNKWNASKCANIEGKAHNTIQPVGSYTSGASPYGISDMMGNVWEWCADWYDPDYYKKTPSRNPMGPLHRVEFANMEDPFYNKINGARVLRGGSFRDYPNEFRCALRYNCYPKSFDDNIGFRCVMNPVLKKSSSK